MIMSDNADDNAVALMKTNDRERMDAKRTSYSGSSSYSSVIVGAAEFCFVLFAVAEIQKEDRRSRHATLLMLLRGCWRLLPMAVAK